MNQAGRIARNSPAVLQPLGIFLAGGAAGALLLAIGIGLLLTRLGAVGAGLAGFLAATLAAGLLLAGYAASVEIARRVVQTLSPAAGGAGGPAWSVRDHALDLAGIAVASLLIGPLRLAGRSRPGGAGRLAAPWGRVVELVTPAMAVERLDLRRGLERAGQMACDNSLLISPSRVAAGWAGAIAGLPFVLGGGLLGRAVAGGIELSQWASPLKAPLSLAAGIVVASVLISIAIAEAAYSSAAYRACLYSWARSVETSRSAGDAQIPAPPPPLAASLTGMESLTAPVFLNSNKTQS